MSPIDDAWARLEPLISGEVLEDAARASAAIRGIEHARVDVDGGRPFRIQLFLWQSPIDGEREAHEDRAMEIFSELSDRLAARAELRELDALREARFEQHVVEALDVALFRSSRADVALIADAPSPEAPVFVIAELWARRRPIEREQGEPVSISDAAARLRELTSLELVGRDREACTEAMTAQGWTIYREWEDALAMWRDTQSARLAFHEGACDLVAASLGELPAADPDAAALVRAMASSLEGEPVTEDPVLDAVEQIAVEHGGTWSRVIADAATATLRLELEPAPTSR